MPPLRSSGIIVYGVGRGKKGVKREYIYIYVCMCTCACVCLQQRKGDVAKNKILLRECFVSSVVSAMALLERGDMQML